jgi:hypothetical protein
MALSHPADTVGQTGSLQDPGAGDPVLPHVPADLLKIDIMQDPDLFPRAGSF